jgi:hypothetical protein
MNPGHVLDGSAHNAWDCLSLIIKEEGENPWSIISRRNSPREYVGLAGSYLL